MVAVPAQADPGGGGEAGVERFLNSVRHDPARLRSFLLDLPKGGDLHNHLSGAASTELLISLAAQDNLCIDSTTFVAAGGPCGAGQRPATDTSSDPAFHRAVLMAWSMEGFQPGLGESGHDHFFNTFGKFGAVTGPHRVELLADVVDRAGRQNEQYLETMLTRQGGPLFTLSQGVTFTEDFAAMRAQVLAGGTMAGIVAAAGAEITADEARLRSLLSCATLAASPGCGVTVQYIQQINRNNPPNVVFTFMVSAFEFAAAGHRTVALNMVSPEEGEVSIRDYRLHMRMLEFLRGVYPQGHITLHAGELVAGLVKPEELTYHISQAVRIAHAERIGHGVDVLGEDDARELLRAMADQHVMVEINLTSNAQILEVSGPDHPFPTYRDFRVPLTLSTDDEGVSRIDLTHEYQRATTDYRLRYRDLKTLARTSLEHAFLTGASLWRGPDTFRPAAPCAHDRLGEPRPSAPCRALLASSAKASLQWQQEAKFTAFERRYG
ncbi:adenosine deaminase [Actinophytocola sp.]|uniref:adenosine deaminase family protein n=1 Tax=Actinophytocola sp. TaxID=1872138 RepID=UPI002D806ADC|nr:adenosine deaminase [Actinophytocola sp.]HET9144368.1 adenosine deaminase [Actinophytocola sp.]